MTQGYLCRPGTYAAVEGLKNCTLCPAGSFSDEFGLILQVQCQQCDAGRLCSRMGYTSMYDSVPCEQGYICDIGTTLTVMKNSPVPEGYFTRMGAKYHSYADLCPPGRYCEQGTSDRKQRNSFCLSNYYCPRGTSAKLGLDGNYVGRVYMVPREPHIERLKELISDSLDDLRVSRYEKMMALNETRTAQYEKYMRRKKRNEQRELQYYYAMLRQSWELKSWIELNATISERIQYLNFLQQPEICDQDKQLPAKLIELYFRNGKQLKCPFGTVSGRSSWCVGQCVKDPESTRPITIVDPFDHESLSEDLVASLRE